MIIFRFSHLHAEPHEKPARTWVGLSHLGLLGLLVFQAQLVAALCRAYGPATLLGPMRLGYFLLTLGLWAATGRLDRASFLSYRTLRRAEDKKWREL